MKPFEKAAILFLLKHLAAGCAGAVVLATGLLLLDVANLATLIWSSDHGVVATMMLYGGLMTTFGTVSMSIGIMGMEEDERL
ncbi:hypothetical protein [Azospirillum thermophilum]|uniref:Uncharacterized protein n=1 Tax=Azospirillum thermophilum TaxID=2202148 RepID=A0A2S2CS91_9PROT|nr:hypothetical protein [Azospirillum thermophilum]AWK87346.1 hypothetical protein DEW08_14965 [Azospirillum thermophilum]